MLIDVKRSSAYTLGDFFVSIDRMECNFFEILLGPVCFFGLLFWWVRFDGRIIGFL